MNYPQPLIPDPQHTCTSTPHHTHLPGTWIHLNSPQRLHPLPVLCKKAPLLALALLQLSFLQPAPVQHIPAPARLSIYIIMLANYNIRLYWPWLRSFSGGPLKPNILKLRLNLVSVWWCDIGPKRSAAVYVHVFHILYPCTERQLNIETGYT